MVEVVGYRPPAETPIEFVARPSLGDSQVLRECGHAIVDTVSSMFGDQVTGR